MMVETVRIFCENQAILPERVEDVLVRFYSGDTFVTSAYTDADGIAEVGLDGSVDGTEYTIRMSKTGVSFDKSLGDSYTSPQEITVYSPVTGSPSGTNDFTVNCETHDLPSALEPNMCRCSGFFYDLEGRPISGAIITFINRYNPTLVAGAAILGSWITKETNSQGYVEVDLYRTGLYDVVIEGMQQLRPVKIPEKNAQSLPDLIFPQVKSISYTPASISVPQLQQEDVEAAVLTTGGVLLDDSGSSYVEYESADPGIATVGFSNGVLRIYGNEIGTTTISGTPVDVSITSVPALEIEQTPLTVTVT